VIRDSIFLGRFRRIMNKLENCPVEDELDVPGFGTV